MENNVGSISTGTLRKADLIESFLQVIRLYDPTSYGKILADTEYGELIDIIEDGLFDDSDSEETAAWLLDELIDILQYMAPNGFSFGAHIGDGADFGFWRI